MDTLIGYGLSIIHAAVSPINCVGNLGADVLHSVGTFVQCVGHNLAGSAAGATSTGAEFVNAAASTVSSIGA